MIHIREDTFVNNSDVYVYFPTDDMFTTNSEFAVNQRYIIAHLFYDGERVLIIGLRCRIQIYLSFTGGSLEPCRMYTTTFVTSVNARNIIRDAGRPNGISFYVYTE